MGRTKLQKITIDGAIALFVLVAFVFAFLIAFNNRSKKGFIEIANQNNNSTAKTEALNISNQTSSALSSAEILAEMASQTPDDKEKVSEFLSNIVENTIAESALWVDKDYLAFSQDGTSYDLNLVSYKDLFSANASSVFGVVDEETQLSFFVCKTKTRDNHFILAYIPITELEGVFHDNVISQYCFLAVMNRGYEVLGTYGNDTDSAYFANDSFWKNVKAAVTYRTSVAVFTQKLRDSSSHVVELKFGADDRYFCSQSIDNTDCYVILGVEAAYMSKTVGSYMKADKIFKIEIIISLFVMIAIFVVIMVVTNFHSKVKNKELEGKADTDLLTGLSNKLSTEAKIQEYIDTSPGAQGVLILIDVDNFKKINDTMGHAFGDEVLRNLGIRLKSLYRVTDIIGRIGGDEFIVFLKDIPDIAIIEREARKLETFFNGFEVGEYVKYSVTASLGAAIYSMDGTSFEELYKNADEALYDAKHKGKKQLFFYKQKEKDELLKAASAIENQVKED